MRSRTIAIAIACCLIVAAGFLLFQYETKALFWHVRHGSIENWDDLQIRVPLKYNVNLVSSRSIQIFVLPGPFRARLKAPFGVISIFHASDDAEGIEIAQLSNRIEDALQGQGFRLVNTRSLEIAGTPMECRERLAENFRFYGPAYSVHCQTQSNRLFAEFEGSSELLNEFYSVASGITKAKTK
jgi:hypothetical protein